MKENFLRLIGSAAKDGDHFKFRRRVHQGWWRTAVLLEDAGPNPSRPDEQVCNTLRLTDDNYDRNYLHPDAVRAVRDELKNRRSIRSGIIMEPRIWNNLLSSQPLCFNFWGPLRYNHNLANQLLSALIPRFGELIDIGFERKPKQGVNLTDDNSAFDVMIEYIDSHGQRAILGMECKYVDHLRSKLYDYPSYRAVYKSAQGIFAEPYEFYIQPDLNQLFRSQLMACAHEQEEGVHSFCALFCAGEDQKALDTGRQFQAALIGERFLILTYEDFIEALQKLDIDWETRCWSMLLWSRYVGLDLSEAAYQAYING